MTILLYRALDKLNRILDTGNLRYEFEHLYAENPDPWRYATSPFEQEKHARTLAFILAHRRGGSSLLDIGCGNAIFAKLCAPEFDNITGVDFSRIALKSAQANARDCTNIRFVRSDIRALALGERFDVAACSGVLNINPIRFSARVLKRLDAHLAPGGILVYVASTSRRDDPWGQALASHYRLFAETRVDDVERPYRVAVFEDAGAPLGIR